MGVRESSILRHHAFIRRCGVDCEFSSPAGDVYAVRGMFQHIAAIYDLETRMLITGNQATVTVVISDLSDQGATVTVSQRSQNSWKLKVTDEIAGELTFRVSDKQPDLSAGVSTFVLEPYVSG